MPVNSLLAVRQMVMGRQSPISSETPFFGTGIVRDARHVSGTALYCRQMLKTAEETTSGVGQQPVVVRHAVISGGRVLATPCFPWDLLGRHPVQV